MVVPTEVSFDYTGKAHRPSDIHLVFGDQNEGTTWNSLGFVRTWRAAARRTLSALGLISSMLDAMVVSGRALTVERKQSYQSET